MPTNFGAYPSGVDQLSTSVGRWHLQGTWLWMILWHVCNLPLRLQYSESSFAAVQ